MFYFLIWISVSVVITFLAFWESLDAKGKDRQYLAIIALLSWLWPLALIGGVLYYVVWLVCAALGIDVEKWWY